MYCVSKHGRYNIEKTDIASAFLVVKKVVTDKKKKRWEVVGVRYFEGNADRIGNGLDVGCERKRYVKADLWVFCSNNVLSSGGIYWDVEDWGGGEWFVVLQESWVTFYMGFKCLLDS